MGLFGIRGELPISEPGGSRHVDRTLLGKGKEAGRAATAVKKLAESAGQEGGRALVLIGHRSGLGPSAACGPPGFGWVISYTVDNASLAAQTIKNLPATRETRVPSLAREDPLQKGKATHSSFLAWRSPWTGEPGRLQSTGSQSQTRLSDSHSLYLSGLILF